MKNPKKLESSVSTDDLQERSNNSISIGKIEEELQKYFDFRYNSIKNQVEAKFKEQSIYEPANENTIFRHLHLNKFPIPMSKLKILLGSDFVEEYNPLTLYFERNKTLYQQDVHDDYISKLVSYCDVDDPVFFARILKFWMVSSVATILNTSELNKTIFVIFNNKQNSGKTTFVRNLFPNELREYVMENQLDDSKDGIITLSKAAFHILDEMEPLEKMRMQSFKSIISKDKIDLRPPYGLNILSKPRITNFIGTSDRFGFLKEDVGTARFIVQEIKKFDFSYSKNINSNILWSQAYYLYRKNQFLSLLKSEKKMIEETNKRFIEASYISECITDFAKPSDKENGIFMQTHEIIKKLQSIHGPIPISDRKIGHTLNSLGFERVKFYCPEKRNSLFGFFLELSTRNTK